MAQSIVLQVGQSGNQIGARFWDLVLQEHAAYNKQGSYDEAIGTFFANYDARGGLVAPGEPGALIGNLRARAVLVDMEEGVLNQVRRSRIRDLFGDHQFVAQTSGSGNNWAVGYHEYGPAVGATILEAVRVQAEQCDALASFFTVHSAGGGTGSGLGSFLTEALADAFPDAVRFSNVVLPSEPDDVVTSPYNSVLTLRALQAGADCVLPVENEALSGIAARIRGRPAATLRQPGGSLIDSAAGNAAAQVGRGFDEMNSIVAHLLMNATSSMRFAGPLNVDINELATNLVPFPTLKLLLAAVTPQWSPAHARNGPADHVFADAFSRDAQLLCADPRRGRALACALIARGDWTLGDLRRNADRLAPTLRFPSFNPNAWKIGLCRTPPLGQRRALLALSNSTCAAETLGRLESRFLRLYRRRANLHHYLAHMPREDFGDALESLRTVRAAYEAIDA